MTKRIKSKKKIYLQLGANIWGKAPYIWKEHKKDKWKSTPGEHKKKHRPAERISPLKNSDVIHNMSKVGYLISKPSYKIKLSYYEPKYVSQLKEKQKFKAFYANTLEAQFRNYRHKATTYKGRVGDNLIKIMEKRLDTALYRAHFVNTMYQARQLISHGHILVNNKKQDIASYLLKPGDIVKIEEKCLDSLHKQYNWSMLERASSHVFKACAYIEVDYRTMSFIYLYTPYIQDVKYSFALDMNKIIRHYI